jgi:hypothetical protein
MSNETAENADAVNSDKKIFQLEEQHKIDNLDEKGRKTFDAINFNPNHGFMEAPKFLGLPRVCTSYYIGAAWLTEDNSTEYKNAVVVNPKKIGHEGGY